MQRPSSRPRPSLPAGMVTGPAGRSQAAGSAVRQDAVVVVLLRKGAREPETFPRAVHAERKLPGSLGKCQEAGWAFAVLVEPVRNIKNERIKMGPPTRPTSARRGGTRADLYIR
jgi:hypothetical protein